MALGVAGALSVAAILTRAGATPFAWVPPVVGAVVGVVVLTLLARRLRAWRADLARPGADRAGVNRRAFFRIAGVAAASALLVGIGSRVATATSSSIAAIRRALQLPAPRSTVAVPEGAELDIPGISPLFTSNREFYRVDTALTVPEVDPSGWRLVVDGMVDRRVELTFDDLVGMGLDEYAITLTCVSNEVGGGLLGTATWLGVPVRKVLRRANPAAGADMVLSRSSTASPRRRRSRR